MLSHHVGAKGMAFGEQAFEVGYTQLFQETCKHSDESDSGAVLS